jgi:hypothetical protein
VLAVVAVVVREAAVPSSPRWRCWSPIAAVVAAPLDLAALVAIALVAAVVAEQAPLDLDMLAALVAIALVSGRRCGSCGVVADLVVAELAAELVAAPLDLDVLAAPRPRRARHQSALLVVDSSSSHSPPSW